MHRLTLVLRVLGFGLGFALVAAPWIGSTASARSIAVEAYTSAVAVQADGALQVQETLQVRFAGGPFTSFRRQIPNRGSDDIDIRSASGAVRTQARRRTTQVEWTFPACRDTVLEFTLAYHVLGAVRAGDETARLDWRPFASERKYGIRNAQTIVSWPADWRMTHAKVRRGEAVAGARSVQINVPRLNKEQAMRLRLEFEPRPELAPPVWQRAQLQQRTHRAGVMAAAGAILLVGIMLTWVQRRESLSDRFALTGARAGDTPPDLPPALVAALHHGSAGLAGAQATLFDLAERGVLVFNSTPAASRWKSATQTLQRRTSTTRLTAWEQIVTDAVFTHESSDQIPLQRAWQHIGKSQRVFDAAVHSELQRRGAIDPDAEVARRRMGTTVGIWLLLAGAGLAVATVLWARTGPVALVLMGAPALVAGIAAIVAARMPIYSATWSGRISSLRASRAWLNDHTRAALAPDAAQVEAWLPHAVAFGLGPSWVEAATRWKVAAPKWFHQEHGAQGYAGLAPTVAVSAGVVAPGVSVPVSGYVRTAA